MRATISFDIDVEQVEDTMGMLVAQEAHNLRAAADMLEEDMGPRSALLEEVTCALELLQSTASQLEQYRNMLLSFEKTKYETNIPQPADSPAMSVATLQPGDLVRTHQELSTSLETMGRFGEFMDKLNTETVSDGTEDELKPQEG